MTFLHASLLLGSLLALVPIGLHLLGRREPKTILFPAIRFVRQTAIQAQKGWTVKRWLLLIIRVCLVLLAALALASPRVPSSEFANYILIGLLALFSMIATAAAVTAFASRKTKALIWGSAMIALLSWIVSGTWLLFTGLGKGTAALPSSSGPIAAAFVMDTSPSMGYMFRNETRLGAAKQLASWLMDRLPPGSQIAIVNSDSNVRLLGDRTSANRLLEKTIVEGRAAGMAQRISNSIDALRKSDLDRREVYVLSDLNGAGWRDADVSGLAAKLSRAGEPSGNDPKPAVLLQVVDVGVEREKKNWGIKKYALSQQSTVPGSSVAVSAEIEGFPGSGAEQMTVELLVESIDRNMNLLAGVPPKPELKVLDRQLIDVPDGGMVPVRFIWKDLVDGTNHGQIRISRSDPLEIDDVVFLSVEARHQGQSLVIANDTRDAQLVALAIAPEELPATDKATTSTKIENYARFGLLKFEDYSNIVLYDPSDMDADTVDRLQAWVEQGGGLLILLGSASRVAEDLTNSPLIRLLPGTAKRLTRRPLDDRGIVLSPAALNHPIWSIFERPVEEVPWVNYPVFRHWDLEDLRSTAFPLMRFTQSELPAITEDIRKRGRILTWALPYPEPFSHRQGEQWSELTRTTASAEWPFGLFVGCVRYLASWNDQQLNYRIDEPAVLDNNVQVLPQKYVLFDPSGEQSSVESGEDILVCNYTRYPGIYRLKGLRPQGPIVRGFSVNVDRQEIELNRATQETLDGVLGKDNYRVAKEKSEIESSLGEGRYGRELTPYMMVMLVMLFMAEQTMASRFYGSKAKEGSSVTPGKPRSKGAA